MSNEKNVISWTAPEFRHYEKNVGWYITLLGVTIMLIGFFVIQKDYFAAITIFIISCLIVFFSRQKPELMDVEVTQKGIRVDSIEYPYKQVHYFWIVDNQNHKTLNFETTAYVNRLVVIELLEQNPEEIRQYLLQHLPEHQDTAETLTQKIMHRLKF